jgi:hypothetical protein
MVGLIVCPRCRKKIPENAACAWCADQDFATQAIAEVYR